MYILDGTTLKNPQQMEVIEIETSRSHQTLNGEVKKDIVNQRKAYSLTFKGLTQTQLNDIITIYNKRTAVSFSVSDGDLTITATDVWVSIESEQYNTQGSEYRADLVLILEETG